MYHLAHGGAGDGHAVLASGIKALAKGADGRVMLPNAVRRIHNTVRRIRRAVGRERLRRVLRRMGKLKHSAEYAKPLFRPTRFHDNLTS